MKVLVSDKEIIGSGTLVVSGNDSLNFSFDEVNPNIFINIHFINDQLNPQPRFQVDQKSAFSLNLNLYNLNNQLGTGSTTPLHLLNINGHKIYLRFMTYSLKDSSGTQDLKTFHYTWFKGEKL